MGKGSQAELSTALVNVDENKLQQVVRNLVSNGLKFTPQGGDVQVEVEVIDGVNDAGFQRKELKVSVTDSGAGISQVM